MLRTTPTVGRRRRKFFCILAGFDDKKILSVKNSAAVSVKVAADKRRGTVSEDFKM